MFVEVRPAIIICTITHKNKQDTIQVFVSHNMDSDSLFFLSHFQLRGAVSTRQTWTTV